jgi:hypothetical protein
MPRLIQKDFERGKVGVPLDQRGQFEEIERQQFGKDGYEDAVAQIGQIEQALGFADLAQFTAPPPPKA